MSDSGQQIRTYWEIEADRIINILFEQDGYGGYFPVDNSNAILAAELEKMWKKGKTYGIDINVEQQ